jgi:hypothetical protein
MIGIQMHGMGVDSAAAPTGILTRALSFPQTRPT